MAHLRVAIGNVVVQLAQHTGFESRISSPFIVKENLRVEGGWRKNIIIFLGENPRLNNKWQKYCTDKGNLIFKF
jgi:hypothetical protein